MGVPLNLDKVLNEAEREKLPFATEQDLERLRHVFSKFDADGGGTIDVQELGECMRGLDRNPTQAELDQMIAFADKDGNGVVDFEEFAALMGYQVELEDVDAEVLAEVFRLAARVTLSMLECQQPTDNVTQLAAALARRVYDKDGSGYIDRNELKAMFRSLGTQSFRCPSDRIVDSMIQEADVDGDGRINYSECAINSRWAP